LAGLRTRATTMPSEDTDHRRSKPGERRVAIPARAAPSVEINLPLEGLPGVRFAAMTAEDHERLMTWLASVPELARLVGRAIELGERDWRQAA
jgi:hypothetical protein